MTVNSEKIRSAILPYLSESIALPEGLLSLLEEADSEAKTMAETVEGLLGLYAANMISENSLKIQLRATVEPQVQWGTTFFAAPGSGYVPVGETPIVSGTSIVHSQGGMAYGQLVGIGPAVVHA